VGLTAGYWFLNFSADRSLFTVVVPAEAFDNFPDGAPQVYEGKNVEVLGLISMHENTPQIVVNVANQIRIQAERDIAIELTKVIKNKSWDDAPRVAWNQANEHVGKEVIVTGKITRIGTTNNFWFLNFSQDRNAFVALVRAESFDKFPDGAPQLYEGTNVEILGTIELFKGKPEIILTDESQIHVITDTSESD
jgi:DNA/RNA endonuclease YhcR with UshA esterase domain